MNKRRYKTYYVWMLLHDLFTAIANHRLVKTMVEANECRLDEGPTHTLMLVSAGRTWGITLNISVVCHSSIFLQRPYHPGGEVQVSPLATPLLLGC